MLTKLLRSHCVLGREKTTIMLEKSKYCVLDIRNSDMSLVKRHCMQQAVWMFFLLLLKNRVNAFVDILYAFNLKDGAN